MKRPRTTTPKRPRTTPAGVAKTRKDAAVQLVRLEFDLGRIEMGMAQARDRLSSFRAEHEEKSRERAYLLDRLNG